MASARTPQKIVPAKIGLTDAELVGHIGDRILGDLRRSSHEISVHSKEFQLHSQAELQSERLRVYELYVRKREAPLPSQVLR
jgi:hypothetical protein